MLRCDSWDVHSVDCTRRGPCWLSHSGTEFPLKRALCSPRRRRNKAGFKGASCWDFDWKNTVLLCAEVLGELWKLSFYAAHETVKWKKIFFSFSPNQKKTTKYMAHRLKHPNEPLFRHRICDGLPPGLYLVIRNDCCCQGYLPFCRARGLSYHLHLLVLHTPAIQPHVSVAKAVISWLSSP